MKEGVNNSSFMYLLCHGLYTQVLKHVYRYCKVRVNVCSSQGIVVIVTGCKDLLSMSINNAMWYYCMRLC